MSLRYSSAACCALALSVVAGAGATPQERPGGSTARAWGIAVIVPGQAGGETRVLAAPPGAIAVDGAFRYPADGSVAAAGSVTTSVAATGSAAADADAWSRVMSLSLFGGEITAAGVTGEAHARATADGASGDVGTTRIARLVVLGHPVSPSANRQIPLGDWGYAITLEQRGESTTQPAPAYHGFVTALDVTLTAAHERSAGRERAPDRLRRRERAGGSACVAAARAVVAARARRSRDPAAAQHTAAGHAEARRDRLRLPGVRAVLVRRHLRCGSRRRQRRLAPRRRHLRADRLAASSPSRTGSVFSVGWNAVGGWRLWLRDARGNEFYYAHLSAYSPFAVDGAAVRAGDVLGYVGDTGDAEGTPPHLHFEIHPVRLLGRGYDGAVDPTTYLDRWRRAPNDVRFEAAAGRIASARPTGRAPKPGAVLLEQTDISGAVMSAFTEGEGGPLLPRLQPPAEHAPVR